MTAKSPRRCDRLRALRGVAAAPDLRRLLGAFGVFTIGECLGHGRLLRLRELEQFDD